MKKRIALILAGTMLMSFVLSACGDDKTASENDAKKEDTVDTSSDEKKKRYLLWDLMQNIRLMVIWMKMESIRDLI